MDTEVLSVIITNDDREELISIINSVLALLYTNESELTNYLHNEVPQNISQFLNRGLSLVQSVQEKELWLKNLREEVSAFTKITVTTAFIPTRGFLETMASKVRKQYTPTLLIESRYDPEIIAGAEIMYNGMYEDLTMRSKIEKTLLTMKNKTA